MAIHQRPANYANVQSLSKDSDLKIREVETVAYRLQGAASPDEQLARRLESGVVVALDEATKKCTAAELRTRRTSQVNSLSPGNLMFAAKPADTAADSNRLWRNMVDPAVGESALAADATFAITIPGLSSSGPTTDMNEALKMRARDVQAQQAGVLYPLVPAPIVRIGSNTTQNDVSEVWNYVTNKKLGTIRKIALGDCSAFALSGDGAYFAAQPFQESFRRRAIGYSCWRREST